MCNLESGWKSWWISGNHLRVFFPGKLIRAISLFDWCSERGSWDELFSNKGRAYIKCSAAVEQYSFTEHGAVNVIYVVYKTFFCWRQKLNEQTGTKLCEMKKFCKKEKGSDIENVSHYFLLRQKQSTHGWNNGFLTPSQRPLDAATVQTHSLSFPCTGTALLPGTFLPKGMVVMTLGLTGHITYIWSHETKTYSQRTLLLQGFHFRKDIRFQSIFTYLLWHFQEQLFLKGYSNINLPLMGNISKRFVPRLLNSWILQKL